MRPFAALKNERGSSLVQSIMAIAMLLMAMFVFVGALQAILSHVQGTRVMNSSQREVNEIIENIRTSVENQQIDFSKTKASDILSDEFLPMAWDVGIQTTAESCPHCQGRYGYVIQPLEDYRGLYLVTIRMTNKAWPDKAKNYYFTVTTK